MKTFVPLMVTTSFSLHVVSLTLRSCVRSSSYCSTRRTCAMGTIAASDHWSSSHEWSSRCHPNGKQARSRTYTNHCLQSRSGLQSCRWSTSFWSWRFSDLSRSVVQSKIQKKSFFLLIQRYYFSQNLSGHELKYTSFVGKPFEISFQYAEIIANKLALASGQPKIEKIYFIGDNPDVDIVGANMYHHLLQQATNSRTSLSGYSLLTDTKFLSATCCESVLVCTGVYDPSKHQIDEKTPWKVPTTIEKDVLEGIKYILNKEGRPWASIC